MARKFHYILIENLIENTEKRNIERNNCHYLLGFLCTRIQVFVIFVCV